MNFLKRQNLALVNLLVWVFSANPAGSARDKGFFLSPASLEHTELTEIDKIPKNIDQILAGYSFSGRLCELCGLCERVFLFRIPKSAIRNGYVVSAASAGSARDTGLFLSPAPHLYFLPLYILGQIWEDIKMDERDLEKIEEVFKRHIGILSKDVGHKLDVLIKGVQLLAEKMDRMILR